MLTGSKYIESCSFTLVFNQYFILQQEEAKELLKVESPENLYTFFQKATLPKQCIDQYSAAKLELEKTRNTIETKRVQIRDLGKQLKSDDVKSVKTSLNT